MGVYSLLMTTVWSDSVLLSARKLLTSVRRSVFISNLQNIQFSALNNLLLKFMIQYMTCSMTFKYHILRFKDATIRAPSCILYYFWDFFFGAPLFALSGWLRRFQFVAVFGGHGLVWNFELWKHQFIPVDLHDLICVWSFWLLYFTIWLWKILSRVLGIHWIL